jgi:hypothetical protein
MLLENADRQKSIALYAFPPLWLVAQASILSGKVKGGLLSPQYSHAMALAHGASRQT